MVTKILLSLPEAALVLIAVSFLRSVNLTISAHLSYPLTFQPNKLLRDSWCRHIRFENYFTNLFINIIILKSKIFVPTPTVGISMYLFPSKSKHDNLLLLKYVGHSLVKTYWGFLDNNMFPFGMIFSAFLQSFLVLGSLFFKLFFNFFSTFRYFTISFQLNKVLG